MLGALSTTDDVLNTDGFKARITGKSVIITGGNSGLGLETAKCLAGCGAEVLLMCRSEENGKATVETIKKVHADARVEYALLDLSSLQSVRDAANAYISTGKPLHILINNAGVMACPKTYTKDGHEWQFGVNHLSHFLFTGMLLPILEKSGTTAEPSRVITLSSFGHCIYTPDTGIIFDDLKGEKEYTPWVRYGHSKFANLLFAKELQNRCTAKNLPILSVSVHPGVIAETKLMRHHSLSAALWTNLKELWYKPAKFITLLTAPQKTTAQGAATQLFCTGDPALEPGAYYEDCHPSDKVHPKANDAEMARRLWEESEKLVDASFL